MRHDRIDAPWLLEGPIDGESFRTYVEKVLLPTLREGDIVIMDNLGSHKGKAVRALIRSAGAKLFFLPKYSPDLNPIEQVFAKLKHLLRKAAARTVEAICIAIGELLEYLLRRGMRQLLQQLRLSSLNSSRLIPLLAGPPPAPAGTSALLRARTADFLGCNTQQTCPLPFHRMVARSACGIDSALHLPGAFERPHVERRTSLPSSTCDAPAKLRRGIWRCG